MPQSAWQVFGHADLNSLEQSMIFNVLDRTHLFRDALSLVGGVFKLGDDCIELVCLVLDRLHLLPDRVHLAVAAEESL